MLLLLSYLMQPFRPRLELSRWRQMLSFSAWLQVNNILSYFSRHTEKVLVSRMADIAAVGSLQLAREIGQLLREMVALGHPLGCTGAKLTATLLRETDHLVLVLPYSAASHHAIGAAELAQMKTRERALLSAAEANANVQARVHQARLCYYDAAMKLYKAQKPLMERT